MRISELAVKRPITTTMLILLMVILGGVAFFRVNLDLYPDMVYPAAVIMVDYSGVGPEEIENIVARPMESAIATVTNIKSLSSTSSSGMAVLYAEFNWGTDMDFAVMDIRERLDLIEGYLPDGVGNPTIIKLDPSLMPMIQLGISGDRDLVSLKKLVEDRINPRLERLEGVASVELIGGKEREIQIILDQTKLHNYQIDLSTVVSTLVMENMNISGGHVKRGNSELLVRVTGKFNSIDQIGEVLIPAAGGMVYLDELAEIVDTFKELNNKARLNQNPSVALLVQKQTDANTVTVSRLVKAELKEILEVNPDLEIIPVMDQATFIERALGNVGRNALFGALLAVLILFIFLRNFRSTLIIAVAIPVSIITTFMLIYFGDLTINMMTLGGLALGVGMLVDNSIVVLENIYRYRRSGANRVEAAIKGSQEVGMAITASTLTTIIVFLPILFVGGLASSLFKEMALTVTFSLLASLLVSLTLIPVMSSQILKIKRNDRKGEGEQGVKDGLYLRCLNWCLSHRVWVIGLTIAAMIGSIALFPLIGSEFMPAMDQGQFTVRIELPYGTSLEETDQVAAIVEERILQMPEVDYLLTNVGSSGEMSFESRSTEISSLNVKLKRSSERERSLEEIMEELRNTLKVPDAKISVTSMDMMGGMGGKPVVITVKGDDLEVLEGLTRVIRDEISQVSGIREIEDTISQGNPELRVKVNRSLAARLGLRVAQIGSTLETAIKGKTATRFEVGGKEFDITIKMDRADVNTPELIKELLIPSPTGAKVPLKRIAEFSIEKGPRQILRHNQVRYVDITADLFESDLGTAMKSVQERIEKNIVLPEGYLIEYGGQFKEMQDSFIDLFYAFLLAILLVYMVMASQFESLLHPFVIMFSVPMAVIGVLPGLFITGQKLSVLSIIGVIMLAGIVVNNAIVLVDYINTLRARGKALREAILEAGLTRLRPIMMTALTTILGLLPLALGIGEGAEVQVPLAIVVIGGLSISTLLTLFVVPVIYSILERKSEQLISRNEKPGAES